MVQYMQALYGLYMPEEKFEGQGMVEYALILVLVSIAAILVLTTMGGKVAGVFTKVNSNLGS